MNQIFREWKIIPLYILLVMLGELTYYLHSSLIITLSWIVYLLILAWVFKGITLKPLPPKIKGIESIINNTSLLFLPIVSSIVYLNSYPYLTIGNFFVSSILSFLISLSFAFLIIANHDLINTGDPDFEKSRTLINFVVIGVTLVIFYFRGFISTNLSNLLLRLTSDLGIFITCALTFVLLCATLSLLAFTYILTIDIDKKKKIMQKNGEYFFSSTILSIISLILIFSISMYVKSSIFFYNFNTILNLDNYLRASLLVFLIIIFIITFFYSFIYIIKGIYSSSKVLNIKWTAD